MAVQPCVPWPRCVSALGGWHVGQGGEERVARVLLHIPVFTAAHSALSKHVLQSMYCTSMCVLQSAFVPACVCVCVSVAIGVLHQHVCVCVSM